MSGLFQAPGRVRSLRLELSDLRLQGAVEHRAGGCDSRASRALVADSDPLHRALTEAWLLAEGYQVVATGAGERAGSLLKADPHGFDLVLVDRHLEGGLDGLALLRLLKADPATRDLPVIMQSGKASKDELAEGIKAGVFYYLVKPFHREMLVSLAGAAMDSCSRYRRLRREVELRAGALALMTQGTFKFRTPEEANRLAVTLAATCPEQRNLVVGLSELLLNAVEHGNLGISYTEKTELITQRRWQQEVAARLEHPEHRDKQVKVRVRRRHGVLEITIKDHGRGFDWRKFLTLDPKRASVSHGRGIALARALSFDEVEYHGPGNEVTGRVLLKPANRRSVA